MKRSAEEILSALAAPFDQGEIRFKPQTISGNRALAIPYIDARVVMDRLDEVLGALNWQDSYTVLPDGAVVCRLQIRVDGEWIAKEDVGGESEQPDEGDRRKAAFSDALKRAAVKLGCARYLYRQKPQWVDYDPQKKQFVRQPVLPGQAPGGATVDARAPADTQAQKNERRVLAAEERLIAEGLCRRGELSGALGDGWLSLDDAAVTSRVQEFVRQRRAATQPAQQRA